MKRFFKLTAVLAISCCSIVIFYFSIASAGSAGAAPDQYASDNQTDDLKAKVLAILSGYDPSSLTAADANAINNAFRQAGVRRGSGQREAIEAAGFDAKEISTLDPPPDRKEKHGRNSENNE